MKKKLFNLRKGLLLIVCCFHVSSYAQQAPTLAWANGIGSTAADWGWSIVVDANGNSYVTGSFGGTADFDPGPNTANLIFNGGFYDIFVAKYDANGNYVWAIAIGGAGSENGQSIAVDTLGNVYITGLFNGTVDFDPGPGTMSLTATGNNADLYIAKYDTDGNYIWAKSLAGADNVNGEFITLDTYGNIYITGAFQNTADFDPGQGTASLTATGNFDIFVAKYAPDGNYIWAKNMGGSGIDRGLSTTVDASGNVYTTGFFNGTADFDPGTGVANLTSKGSSDIFISKLDVS
jgi:hypothetical protein